MLTTFALRNFSRGRMGGVWKVGISSESTDVKLWRY